GGWQQREDVADGGPEEEAGGPDDGGAPQAEPSAEREKADGRKPQARHPDFGLEGAWFPADEPGGHVAEEDVANEVKEERDPDREQQEPREQLLDHGGCGQWARPPPQAERGSEQPQGQEGQGEVGQGETDERPHSPPQSLYPRLGG